MMARIREIRHDESIGQSLMLLVQTSRLVNKYMDAYFYHKARLSFIKFLVLKVLATKGEVMTPSEIAEWTQTEGHNITTLIRRLAKDDLISTKPSDKDRRSTEVILTDKGRETLDRVMPIARDIIEKLMSSFTEADAEKFSQMLEVLRDNAHDGLESITKI
jgi:DNA-binding MarR family transcriptional regulator